MLVISHFDHCCLQATIVAAIPNWGVLDENFGSKHTAFSKCSDNAQFQNHRYS